MYLQFYNLLLICIHIFIKNELYQQKYSKNIMNAAFSQRVQTPYFSDSVSPKISLLQALNEAIQINCHDSHQIKCHKLVQINENLKYNISLLQTQLQTVKKLQNEKSNENKKIKQKLKSKLQKQQEMKRHITLQQSKIKKLLTGLQALNLQVQDQNKKQQNIRDDRIDAQENKNKMYQDLNLVEKQYKELLSKIKQREGVYQALEQAYDHNQQLQRQVADIQDCLNQQKSSRQSSQQIKKQRTNKIKQLNQRVIQLQKQQNSLKSQINTIENHQARWQNQRQRIQQRTVQAVQMHKKLQQSKNSLLEKRKQLSEINSMYEQFCVEQIRLKRQIMLKNQCAEERRKYKESLKKKVSDNHHSNQKIQLNSGLKSKNNTETETENNKFQSYLKRYQNITNKN